MARPNVLTADTKLYCPAEPEGRVFPAGSEWPGDAWSDQVGGERVGGNAAAGALKDLIEANDRLDQMGQVLASKDHDLALMASQRDEANGKVADLEQRAIAAEKAQAEALEQARNYMLERDQARAQPAGTPGAELDEAKANLERVTGELAAAHQTIADQNSQIEALTAPAADTTTPAKGKKADAAPSEGEQPAP